MCQLKFAAKALSLILSVIMLLGVLPTSSFAIEPGDGTVDLEVSSTDIEGTYRYELVPSSENGDSDPVKGGYTGKLGNGYTITLGEDPVNVFDGISFTEKGTYSYKLVPVLTGAGESGVVYDDSITDIKVSVTGDLHADVSPREIKFENSGDNDSVDVGFSASVRLDGMDLTDDMFTFALSPVGITEIPSESNSGEKTEPVETPAPEEQENSKVSDDESEESDTTVSGGEESSAPEDENPESDAETEAEDKAEGEAEAEGESQSDEVESSDTDTAGEDISSGTDTPETGADLLPEFPPVPDNDGVYFEDFGDEPHTFDGSEPVFTKSLSSGAVAFGTVTFTQPGIYTYEIYQAELPLDDEDWTYDRASYVVTVTVTRDSEDKLTAEVQYEKFSTDDDGDEVKEEADEVSFENFFTGVIVEPSPTPEPEITPEPEVTETPEVSPPGEEIVPGQQEESTPAPEEGEEEGLPQESTSPEPTEEPTEPTAGGELAILMTGVQGGYSFDFEYEFLYPENIYTDILPDPQGSITLISNEEFSFGILPEGTEYHIVIKEGDWFECAVSSWDGTVGTDDVRIVPEITVPHEPEDTPAPEDELKPNTGGEYPNPSDGPSLESPSPELTEVPSVVAPDPASPEPSSEPQGEPSGEPASYHDIFVNVPTLDEKEDKFEFTYEFEYPEGFGSKSGIASSGSFKLNSGESYKFSSVPYGTAYNISLDLPKGYVCDPYTWEGNVTGENVVINADIRDEIHKDPGDLSIDGLKSLSEDVAGAAVEYNVDPIDGLASEIDAAAGKIWRYDYYYVGGRDGEYNTHANDDFSLKYQMEFYTSENIPRGGVEIRVPMTLFRYRDSSPCNPTDIGVLQVMSKDDSAPMDKSCFNYFVDGDELVFFNYKDMEAGTNNAWQVVYGGVKIMKVKDGTSWEIKSTARVKFDPEDKDPIDESDTPQGLKGHVDSQATLLSVKKSPHTIAGKSYGPGLYSESQLRGFVSDLPAAYSGDNFSKYRYVVWEVSVNGSGTQPFDLWFKDSPQNSGMIVGYSGITTGNASGRLGQYGTALKNSLNGYTNVTTQNESKEWEEMFYVVVAYPSSVTVGNVIKNDISVTLVPYDLVDSSQTKTSSAQWSYANYEWEYEGNVIGIGKYVMDHDYEEGSSMYVEGTEGEANSSGWLEVYKRSVTQNKDLVADLQFWTRGIDRSFELTHYLPTDVGKIRPENPGHTVTLSDVGKLIPNVYNRIVTVDDAVYCYPGGTSEKYLLTGNDYYFSSVSIDQFDSGYDIWNEASGPIESVTKNQTTKIYAMFADKNGGNGTAANQWEYVADATFSQSEMSAHWKYDFTPAQIKRKPYRVMVVHGSVNYNTECDIYVDVHIRYDSPTIKNILSKHPDLATVQFENLSGISGQHLVNGNLVGGGASNGIGTDGYFAGNGDKDTSHYYHDPSAYKYNEEGLAAFTSKLFGLLLQRDSALISGSSIEYDGGIEKTGSLSNDPEHSRTDVVYSVAMYEGYPVGSRSIAQGLLDLGVAPPMRKKIVFYDLLPLGMNFDPSYEVVAGRLTTKSGDSGYSNGLFDQKGITVERTTVDTNYRNSGRTMLKFLVSYDGDDVPYVASEYALFQGFGIRFKGYWNWDVIDESDLTENIVAAMSVDNSKFIAKDEQMHADNGNFNDQDYNYFAADIDGDGKQDDQVFLAKAAVNEEIAVASTSGITKKVRADSDEYGSFGELALVAPGESYTYEITVTNGKTPETNVVIFDRLENALADRNGIPGEVEFEDTCWYGTFKSIITSSLTEKGIKPVVYYNSNREAPIPSGDQDPMTVLTSSNGWKTAADYGSDLSTVHAVAVSLGDFTLGAGESVSFRIQMTAPNTGNGATFAYNNPSFSSMVKANSTRSTVVGNSVRVRFSEIMDLEIEKTYYNKDEIPDGLKKASGFELKLYDTKTGKREPFAYQEYVLYNKSGNSWTADSEKHATDGDGVLYLDFEQKAVFEDIRDPTRIEVEETPNPFWEPVVEKTQDADTYVYRIKNKAKPVLYVQKKTEGGKASGDEVFKFKLTANGVPAANVLYWVVSKAYTDGRIPDKISEGHTDDRGIFPVKAGQVVAIIGAADFHQTYVVEEVENDEDWLPDPRSSKKNGNFEVNGSVETFTNYYKWKDLYLTKVIKHRTTPGADQDFFKFKIEEVDDSGDQTVLTPISGNKWTLVDEEDQPIPGAGHAGTVATDGTFMCRAAAGRVKVERLEAYKTYRITEVSTSSEFYSPVNGGFDEVTMPLYSTYEQASITNEWLKRPLEVNKVLIYDYSNDADEAAAKAAVFELIVECDPDGSGPLPKAPLANFTYRVIEDGKQIDSRQTDGTGKLSIKGGQSVIFDDAGVAGSVFTVTELQNGTFKQLVPLDDAPVNGEMGSNGGFAKVVNGAPGSVVLKKEWYGLNSGGDEFVAGAGEAALSVSIKGYMIDSGGGRTAWPSTDVSLQIVDSAGNISSGTWKANSAYTLKPGAMVVIPADSMSGYETYEFVEENGKHIQAWGTRHVAVNQETPENGGSATGSPSSDPEVTFVNTAEEIPEKSRLSKRLLNPDTVVEKNAKLTMVIEQWDGTYWNAVSGVPYILGHGGVYESTEVQYTDYTGKIVLRADGGGNMPWVIFTEDKVYAVDVENPKVGDMRAREITTETDNEWGYPLGVGTVDNDGNYTTDMSELDRDGNTVSEAFVNTSEVYKARVGKAVEKPTDTQFTFVLKQITEVNGEAYKAGPGILPGNYEKVIRRTELRQNIPYTVYDSANGQKAGEGVTDKYGQFTLRGGQFAEFTFPDRTLWTVNEDVPPGFTLKSLDILTGTGRLTKLAENLLLIGAEYRLSRAFTVRIDANGGTITPAVTSPWNNHKLNASTLEWENLRDYDSFTLPNEIPVRDGYVFDGWVLNGNEGTLYQKNQSFNVSESIARDYKITFTAKWTKIPVYTVVIDVAGGTRPSDPNWNQYQSGSGFQRGGIRDGTGITLPKAPTRDGWKFTKWLCSLNGKQYDASQNITLNKAFNKASGAFMAADGATLTFTAQWTQLYTVKLDPNGGTYTNSGWTGNQKGNFDVGAKVQLPSTVPVRTGWKFTGWKCTKGDNAIYAANSNTFTVADSKATNHVITLQAQWSQLYTGVLNLASGAMSADAKWPGNKWQYVDIGGSVTMPTNVPTRSGYTFAGWKCDRGNTALYQKGASVTIAANMVDNTDHTVTFVAQWQKKMIAVLYKDGSLIFYETAPEGYGSLHGGVVGEYTEWATRTTDSLTSIPVDWGSLTTSIKSVSFSGHIAPKSMAAWFYGTTNLTSFNSSGLDTSQVTDMRMAFYQSGISSLDLSSWNTGSLKRVEYMLMATPNLRTLKFGSGWNMSKVTSLQQMFNQCGATSLDINSWNVSSVTSLYGTFSGMKNITSLNLSSWNTSNVTNFSNAFSMVSLVTLDLWGWNVSKGTDFRNIFFWCQNLSTIYAKNWTTNTYVLNDTDGIFLGCSQLGNYGSTSDGHLGKYAKPKSAGGWFSTK